MRVSGVVEDITIQYRSAQQLQPSYLQGLGSVYEWTEVEVAGWPETCSSSDVNLWRLQSCLGIEISTITKMRRKFKTNLSRSLNRGDFNADQIPYACWNGIRNRGGRRTRHSQRGTGVGGPSQHRLPSSNVLIQCTYLHLQSYSLSTEGMLVQSARLRNSKRLLGATRSCSLSGVRPRRFLRTTNQHALDSRSSPATPLPRGPSRSSHFSSTLRGDESTIYALSTAPGRAAIAIVRCSGPACLHIYQALCPGKPPPKPRYATLRTLYSPFESLGQRDVLDPGALVLYLPGPNTVTGDDVMEFHIHGGPAVVKAVLSGISATTSLSGIEKGALRYAEPGEFTRRAFYNDRLDLTQVEALGDTLSAETEQQRKLAVRGTANALNDRYEDWRSLLLQARGELEALIDFSEDQHFDDSPAEFTASVSTQISVLRQHIQASIDNAAKGELLRGGISIALLGAPNAGKSSLLNQIVGREAAIVSHEAGTTRDVVEANVDIEGYFCKFGDLAGLRTASPSSALIDGAPHSIGEVEREGIRRAKLRALAADVIVVVLELKLDNLSQSGFALRIESEILETLAQLDLNRQRVLFAVNKVDLIISESTHLLHDMSERLSHQLPKELRRTPVTYISCIGSGQHGSGTQPLLKELVECFKSLTAASNLEGGGPITGWDESLGASERQKLLLIEARQYLEDFLARTTILHGAESTGPGIDVVVAAESLRSAAQSLGKITGRGEAGDVEEVLGVVFEKFCVGK
jgi:tRNA modification GTPase